MPEPREIQTSSHSCEVIMPLYPFKCSSCDKIWEEFQHINDKHVSKCCGRLQERAYPSEFVPFTNKDKLYEFTSRDRDGKLHEIRSSKQYENHLKRNGLVNVSKRERKAARKSVEWHEKKATRKREALSRNIARKCQKEGLSEALSTLASTKSKRS